MKEMPCDTWPHCAKVGFLKETNLGHFTLWESPLPTYSPNFLKNILIAGRDMPIKRNLNWAL